MSDAKTEPKPSNRWVALSMLMALAFLNYLDRKLIFPLLAPIRDELHLSEDQLGALGTGFFVVYACAAPLLGVLSDRVSRKTILLVSCVAWSIVTALSGVATGFVTLLLFRSLTGLGEGGYFPTALSLIGDYFPPNQRGRAIAIHGLFATLGGSAGLAIGGSVGMHYGWRVPFWFAIVPGLILSFVIWRWLHEPPRGASQEKANQSAADAAVDALPPRPYLAIVLTGPVLLLAFSACAATYSLSGLDMFFPLYLKDVHHLSVEKAGVLTGIFFGLSLVGQLGGGVLSDWLTGRVGGARPLLIALPYLLIAPLVISMTRVDIVLFALICFGVAHMGRGFAEPNIFGAILDTVPSRERGTAQGFLLMLTFIGSSISPWLSGVVIRKYGYTVAMTSLGVAAAIAGALALLAFVHVRRKGSALVSSRADAS